MFVYVGAFVAPHHQYIIAIIMTCIIAVLAGFSLLSLILYPLGTAETMKTVLGLIANIGGAIGVLISLKHEDLA